MTQETLLDSSNPESVVDDNTDYLNVYVGEGKKYKTPQDLAKAYFHAESALNNREQRLDELREDFLKMREESMSRATLEELLTKFRNQPLASNEQPPVNEVVQPTLKPEDIKSLLAEELPKHIGAYELQRRRDDNFNVVKAKLTERYGTNYRSQVQDQLSALGISVEQLDEMARNNPALVSRVLGLDAQPRQTDNTQLPRSSVTFRPKVESKHKPMSYYQNLRKQNPKAYYDPKIAIQMDIDSQALGEQFFDTPE